MHKYFQTAEEPNRIHRREHVADVISKNRKMKEMIVALEKSGQDHVINNMLNDTKINSAIEINEVSSRDSGVPSPVAPSGPRKNLPPIATSQTQTSAHGSSHVPQGMCENAGTSLPQEPVNTEARQRDPRPQENHDTEPTVSQEPPSPPRGDPTAQSTEYLLWILQNPVVHQIKWKPKDLKKKGLTRGAKLLGDDVILYSYSSSSIGVFYRHSKTLVDLQPCWRRCLDNCDFFCVQKNTDSSYLIVCAYHEKTADAKSSHVKPVVLKMFNSDGKELHTENLVGEVQSMKWKGTRLMVARPSGLVALWDVDVTEMDEFQNPRTFKTECSWISSIEIEGNTVVTLSNAEPFDVNCKSVIEVWNVDADTVQVCRALRDYKGLICMSYHSGVIIAGSKDRTLRAFNANNADCVKTLKGHAGSINVCACNETYIISGDSKGVIKIWNRQSVMNPQEVDTHALLRTLDQRHKSAVLLMEIGQNFMVTQDFNAKIFYWDFRQFQTRRSCYTM